MARLQARSGDWFALAPMTYEFPDLARLSNDYDANWLVIRLDAYLDGQGWSAADACLATWDLAALASWCDSLAAETLPTSDSWSGLEPNIRVEAGSPAGPDARITIELGHAFRPPKLPAFTAMRREMYVARADLATFADALRAELGPFPVRRVNADGPGASP